MTSTKSGSAHCSCGSEHCWCEPNDTSTAACESRLSCCFQTRIQHRQERERDYQQGWKIRPNRTILATPILALSRLIRGGATWGNGWSQTFQGWMFTFSFGWCWSPPSCWSGLPLCGPHATFAEVGLYSNCAYFRGLPDASGTLPLPARMFILSLWGDSSQLLPGREQLRPMSPGRSQKLPCGYIFIQF